jgi:hypothetical protein
MIRHVAVTTLLALTVGALASAAEPTPSSFAAIDRHALKAPREAEESVESLAEYLAEPAKNDKEKARAVYRWVTDRIAYDTDAFFAGEYPDPDPENVLKKRKAICGGYARLFRALCVQAGIKAVVVEGKVKGQGYVEGDPTTAERHGWNAIKLGDEWHLVDATWGAGGLRDKKFVKAFRDFYFLPPPEALVFTHFPKKPNSQLLPEAISEKEFDRQPRVSARFFEVGLTPSAISKAIAAEDFAGLVKIFDAPGSSLVLKDMPLARSLKAGTTYDFRIETADFPAVIVSSGGRSVALVRNGKLFEGPIIAPRGPIKVQGVVGEGKKIIIWDLLEYTGE